MIIRTNVARTLNIARIIDKVYSTLSLNSRILQEVYATFNKENILIFNYTRVPEDTQSTEFQNHFTDTDTCLTSARTAKYIYLNLLFLR